MPTIPLFGIGMRGKSRFVTSQERINLFLEPTVDGDKAQTAYYSRPGLTRLIPSDTNSDGVGVPLGACVMLISGGGRPTRDVLWIARNGGWDAWFGLGNNDMRGATLVAAGLPVPGSGDYVSMSPVGVGTNLGFAVDGKYAWWITTNGPSVPPIDTGSSGGFPWVGSKSVTFLAGRLIVDTPEFPGQFAWSPLTFTIGAVWSGLDFANAESSPDGLVCVKAFRGELILFGTNTIEFWAPSPTTVFSNIQGTTAPWGLIGQQTVGIVGDQCFFLGRTANGVAQVCVLNGYKPQVISTPEVEYLINEELAGLATANAFAVLGHSFYELNLGTRTLVYDATTQAWAYWETDGSRWAGQFVVEAFGKLIVPDYRDIRTYQLAPDVYNDDGGAQFVRQITSRHVFHDLDRITLEGMILDVETGEGPQIDAVTPRCLFFPNPTLVNTTDATSATVATTTASFTVEFWLYIPLFHTANAGVLVKTSGGTAWRISAVRSTSVIRIDNGLFANRVDVSMTTGVWKHIAFTYDAAFLTLTGYGNATQESQKFACPDMGGASATIALQIAHANLGIGEIGQQCRIGMIRLWNGARTQAQIAASMSVIPPAGTVGLVSHWYKFPQYATSFVNSGTDPTPIVFTAGEGQTTSTLEGVVLSPGRTPQVMLQLSKDGGRTYGHELWQTFGALGEYRTLVQWKRLGRARDLVFRFRVSDPVKVTLVGAAARISRMGGDGG